MALPFGTLGTKWPLKWESAGVCPCTCRSCGVLHSDECDCMVWGECAQCGTGNKLPVFQLDLAASHIEAEWASLPLMCGHGHRPVGLAEIWLNMKKPDVVQFDVKIDCYNPNCSHDPSTCVLTAVNDAKRTMNIKATPCCDKPQLMLVSLKAKYVPFGSTEYPAASSGCPSLFP